VFLRSTKRKKAGKEHRYFSVVENVRVPGRPAPLQKTLLAPGEIQDAQQSASINAIRVFDQAAGRSRKLSLFPADRPAPGSVAESSGSARLGDYQLKRPRQYGACWLASELWRELELDSFVESASGGRAEAPRHLCLLPSPLRMGDGAETLAPAGSRVDPDRYTQPAPPPTEPLLQGLGKELPEQPPPRRSSASKKIAPVSKVRLECRQAPEPRGRGGLVCNRN